MGGNHHLVNIFLTNRKRYRGGGKGDFYLLFITDFRCFNKSSILYLKPFPLQIIRKLLTFFKLTCIVFVIVLDMSIALLNNAADNFSQEAVKLTVWACGLDSAETSRMKQEEKASNC